MYKKMIALFMSLVLLVTVSGGHSVFASTLEPDLSSRNSKALRLSDNTDFFNELVDSESINTFNITDIAEYKCYEVILVDNNTIAKLDAKKLVELIDNGTTLWVEDNNISLKEISRILNLDEPNDRFVNGVQVTGAIVFNQNSNYCIGITGEIETIPEDLYNQTPHEDSDVSSYEPIPIYQSGDISKFSSIKNSSDIKVDLEDFVRL